MEEIAGESKDEVKKLNAAIRCSKAALVLSSLKRSTNDRFNSTHNPKHQEREAVLTREVEDLRIELVKQRILKRRIRLCSVMELLLQIALLFTLWILALMFVRQFL